MLESALDIETAQEFLETDTFDYVFLDDRFAPYRSALETLPLLKPFFGTAKVVIVSSCVAAEHLQDPEALGVTAILDKSNVKDYVTETLKRHKREIADQQAA